MLFNMTILSLMDGAVLIVSIVFKAIGINLKHSVPVGALCR